MHMHMRAQACRYVRMHAGECAHTRAQRSVSTQTHVWASCGHARACEREALPPPSSECARIRQGAREEAGERIFEARRLSARARARAMSVCEGAAPARRQ
eukprot:3409748-Pleurochrysis_carterae.AAC.1